MTAEENMSQPGQNTTEDIAALMQQINSVFEGDELKEESASDLSFEMPASDVLNLIPSQYLREGEDTDLGGETILLHLDNLYDQLVHGKVAMTVAELAYFLPMNLIYRAALDDKTELDLSVRDVVTSVGITNLIKHTPSEKRFYDIARLDDVFKASDAVGADEDDDSPFVMFDEPVEEDEESAVVMEPESSVAIEPEPSEEKPAEAEAMEETPVKAEEPAEEKSEKVEEAAEEAPEERVIEPVETPETPAIPAPPVVGLSEEKFDYPIAAALQLLPDHWVKEGAADNTGDATVSIMHPGLTDQLKQGRVSMSLTMLVLSMSPEFLTDKVEKEDREVDLDLKLIVDSIGVEKLTGTIPSECRDYDIDWMVDPFEKPDVLPKLVKKDKDKPSPVQVAVQHAVEQEEAEIIPYQPTQEGGPESEYHELPGNVNINAATKEELMQLSGMNDEIASQIINYRELNKGFETIFELLELSSVGDEDFSKLTGISAQRKKYHRRKRLADLLKIAPRQVSDLSIVVRALAERTEFSAAVISDGEGLVMAQHNASEEEYDFAAVLPRTMMQLQSNVDLVGLGKISSTTLCIGDDAYTMIVLPTVTLTVVHKDNNISHHGLVLLRKTAKELAWLLSVRAYVGPYIAE